MDRAEDTGALKLGKSFLAGADDEGSELCEFVVCVRSRFEGLAVISGLGSLTRVRFAGDRGGDTGEEGAGDKEDEEVGDGVRSSCFFATAAAVREEEAR
jgi:hypothetical protein